MKAAFLCNSEQQIREVYTEKIINRLQTLTDFNNRVCTQAMLLSGEMDLSHTEYLFSTWGMPTLTAEEIRQYLPTLKAVFYAAGSVQSFARPFLECGIKVFSAWAANAVPVAEYTVAQIILANKGFFATARLASSGRREEAVRTFRHYPGNYEATVGIAGAGMIGKRVIKLLQDYQLKILVFDPFLPDETAAAMGVEKVSLTTLFTHCSVVSNHLANNPQTERIFDYRLFSMLPSYATFLNTGRGAQVIEEDLHAALAARPDLTAVLDVTWPEPPHTDSPLYGLDNCLLTPHIAGSSGNEVQRMAEYMTEEFAAFSGGAPTRFEITKEMLKTMA